MKDVPKLLRVKKVKFYMEDLIPDEEVVVTLSHEGYVKTQPLACLSSATSWR